MSVAYPDLERVRSEHARLRRAATLMVIAALLRGRCSSCKKGQHCGACTGCCSGNGWER